ncbi:transglutaminase-like domain-containing protein [Nocardia sp. alder85J]|uniref:transglutaminase-like domain-containing protein n=1 Tax=Nocardia sp. alder85J TaxID=2862949 RepID=UPI001CD56CE7|nr:transglutaminase family protein [Nocardia sp. alder85J]MCX4093797.1 transglutaminase family protein [Nocardia sp. alder85J]
MKRDVSTSLDIEVQAPTTLEFQITVARQEGLEVIEDLSFELDGRSIVPWEICGPHGTRIHRFDCGSGNLRARYEASVLGTAFAVPASDYDLSVYLRPSRYAESDKFLGFAATEFGYVTSADLPLAVSNWVGSRIRYVAGSSDPIDGAAETLLSGAGVCRDFAHLVVALLRALNVPARLVAVYAPQCVPMDFHAVAEVYHEGVWRVVDATGLAPRLTMVRIATGRDASDVAFLDNHGGDIILTSMSVMASADGPPALESSADWISIW